MKVHIYLINNFKKVWVEYIKEMRTFEKILKRFRGFG